MTFFSNSPIKKTLMTNIGIYMINRTFRTLNRVGPNYSGRIEYLIRGEQEKPLT